MDICCRNHTSNITNVSNDCYSTGVGTRDRLLEAAISLLQRVGYARATTRAIVAEADAHLPAVNYFFGSKEHLLQEAVVEALRRWGQTTMVVTNDPASRSPREQLARSLGRFYSTLEADRSYIVAAVEAFAQAERDEELRAKLADAYDDFRDVVATSVESAAGRPDATPQLDTLILSSVLIALFDGLAIQWLLDPEHALTDKDALHGLEILAASLTPTRAESAATPAPP